MDSQILNRTSKTGPEARDWCTFCGLGQRHHRSVQVGYFTYLAKP